MQNNINSDAKRIGLVMTGGGARAAYQVGVLKALADLLPKHSPCPFQIICGTSAGAVNSTALAADATNFYRSVHRLVKVWSNFHAGQVYRSDAGGVIRTGARWLLALLFGGLGKNNPVSLLDNAPLAELLKRMMDFSGIQRSIDAGALYALSITASGYSTGQSVTFYQGAGSLTQWKRARRVGVPARIGLEHLLASSALPLIFPAMRINREYFGDGSMRQTAPISPALHLGANRIFVIGQVRAAIQERAKVKDYPSFAQIAGHALNSIFFDGLETDIERLKRINRTLELIPEDIRQQHGMELRPVEHIMLAPTANISEIAQHYSHYLPSSIRYLLRGVGATENAGANLVSYLLFEKEYCCALIDLGYNDAMARKEEILNFLQNRKT